MTEAEDRPGLQFHRGAGTVLAGPPAAGTGEPAGGSRAARVLAGVTGFVGSSALGASFTINPGPPPGSTLDQAIAFGIAHRGLILAGSLLQATGSALMVVFCLALVIFAGAAYRLAGWVTLLSGTCLVGISLVEISAYIMSFQPVAAINLPTVLVTSLALIKGLQHAFLLVPALLLPVGFVLARSRLLPRALGYSALVIGAVLQLLGVAGLFDVLQPVVDVALIVQGAWFLIAAAALAVIPPRMRATTP